MFLVMDAQREILQYLHFHPLCTREEIKVGMAFEGSDATLKRLLKVERVRF